MPHKYPLIVDASWREKKIQADSVPHFLHWDIAYLLVLGKPEVHRPTSWAHRITAWKRLLSLVLLGKVGITKEQINEPFSTYSRAYGVEEVGWLAEKPTSKPIGVVSPTVLVRPLPDFQEAHLREWPASPDDDPISREKLRHFVGLAIKQLGRVAQGEDAVARELVRILKSEFAHLGELKLRPAEPGYPADNPEFAILERLTWVTEDLRRTKVTLQISKPGKRWYVPRCKACGQPLTYNGAVEPTSVSGEALVLTCANPECRKPSEVSLSSMMIWKRKQGQRVEVVVWKDRSCPGFASAPADFPPPASIKDNIITFEWDPGQLLGELDRRFLRLRFAGQIEEKSFHDILFGTLLVPGELQPVGSPRMEFNGLPIRPEWRDVLEKPAKPEPHVTNSNKQVEYHFTLNGWPFEFSFTHVHPREEPGLAVGVYPDSMNPEWKHYRLFAFGKNRDRFQIVGFELGKKIKEQTPRQMPWALDTEGGWPDWAAVVNRQDPNEGVLFDLRDARGPQAAAQLQAAASTSPQVVIAVDFGTTNSLVYFQDQAFLEPFGPATNAIETSSESFLNAAWIFAGKTARASQAQEGCFLPDHQAGGTQPDPYLIPSAYWEGGEIPVIRWCQHAPFKGARPAHGFKWDKTGHPNQERREKYLKELLFLTVPYALKKLNLHRERPRIYLGWAFPLAFAKTEYENLKALWEVLSRQCRVEMGFSDVNHFSIDESKANVKAFGQHNPGESFLVADMGGGTIDLALFTFTTPDDAEYHQIGSVQFAGEKYLECLSKERYWDYRDSIQAGTGLLRGNRAASGLVDSFAALAFEFLRTMHSSYGAQGAPKEGATKVRVVLAGNGWRLAQAVRDVRSETFNDYYGFLCETLCEPNLTLYAQAGDLMLRKHWVAQGALKNAKHQAKYRVGELSRSKLPAGRDMTFTHGAGSVSVKWYELVGDGREFKVTSDELRNSISVDLASGPPRPAGWEARLPAAHRQLDMALLREWIAANIEGTPAHLRKGPLQLLLENWWPQVLAEV